ncbi:MAG: hypothetical protein AB1705_28515 [Verrucomicrobiota bacterium]
MNVLTTRRGFLGKAAGAGALLCLGDLDFLPVSAAEAQIKGVRLDPEIVPLVRFIEETPRSRLLEEMAGKVRRGLSYREVVTALMLAGVRNIQPRPVGFKFHAVLVVNSARIASLSAPDSDRWLPIFWALDQYKNSEARDVQEGNWTMAPVDEKSVPPSHQAKQAFIEAMDNWDEAAADAAVAGLARSSGANEIFELFCRYGARDFRDIGHKAIYVANSWRTLQMMGWQHAEPVLRSLAYALLEHEEGNPAKRDAAPDRPWRRNVELAKRIRADWTAGKADAGATKELLETWRKASDAEASQQVVEVLNRGVAPQSVWDALFEGAGELLMRKPGIATLHAVTTTNALHYAWQHSANDETRRMLLLQNAAFLPLFRGRAGAGADQGGQVDTLEPLAVKESGTGALEEIFADISRNRTTASRKALAFLGQTGQAKEFIDAARRYLFLRGNDSHDYKFSSAVLEDYYHVSPVMRDRFLAASTFYLRGSGGQETQLAQRIRAAFNT